MTEPPLASLPEPVLPSMVVIYCPSQSSAEAYVLGIFLPIKVEENDVARAIVDTACALW